MGLHSYNCLSCGHPALSTNLNSINRWMNDVVVIFKDGERIEGAYDGYGGVGDAPRSIGYGMHFSLYHKACARVLGTVKYSRDSKSADDQGHFYARGAHDMPEPKPPARGPTKEKLSPKPPRPKFSIATQITRQKRKISTLNGQIDRLVARRVDEEKKLADLVATPWRS